MPSKPSTLRRTRRRTDVMYSRLCIGVTEIADQAGEVDMVVELGLRSVSGLAGFMGAVFFAGEVDSVVVGDPDSEAEPLAVDWDPICSHCFNRSATLPVFLAPSPLLPMFTAPVADAVGVGLASTGKVGAAFTLRVGSGGCDLGVGRAGVINPSGGGPSISIDTLGCGRGGSVLGLMGGVEADASDLCLCILSIIEVLGIKDGSGGCSVASP